MKKLLLLNIVLLFFTLTYYGQPLSSIQEKFNSLQSFKSDFSQTAYSNSGDKIFSMEGKFYYKKNDKFKIELNSKVIISDGSNIYNYDEPMNRLIITNNSNEPSSISLTKFINEYPKLCAINELSTEMGLNRIQLIPQSDDLGFKSGKIYYDDKFIVRKIFISDFTDQSYLFELTNIDTNISINDDIFTINPPEGTEIIDLR